jgi:ankyrin repeat protein
MKQTSLARTTPAGAKAQRKPSKAALLAAVRAWDVATVDRILAVAPDLRATEDRPGRTLLHLACAVDAAGSRSTDRYGIGTVTTLLAHGLALGAVEPIADDGEIFAATPLWYAVARGANQKLVEHLLALGASPDGCLWAIVWRDDARMCQSLLAYKPKLDLTFAGETPLFYAARLKRLATLDLLVEAGADATIADGKGRTPVDIARLRRLPAAVVERLQQAAKRRSRKPR